MNPADEKPVELLNKLIGISTNRIEVYSFAVKQTESNLLRSLFERLVETSLFCRQSLVAEVYKLGGKPAEGTQSDQDFHLAWLSMHEALANRDNRLLVSACFQLEEVGTRAFRNHCSGCWMLLNNLQRSMLQEQMQLLISDRDGVSNLRNVFQQAA